MKKTKLNFISACNAPRHPITQEYHVLRVAISSTTVGGKPIKKILVTSSLPSEGKTSVSINLAIVLAQAGYKVMLLDCNSLNPSIAHHLGENTPGVSNYLLDTKGSYRDYIVTIDDLALDCLTFGTIPSITSKLFLSKRFSDLLLQLDQDYDYVVIDSPPVLSVTDAADICHLVDGVILVVGSEKVAPKLASIAKLRLEQAHANIIGSVLYKVR